MPVYIASAMVKPAPYSGLEEDCNGFLLQCSMALEMTMLYQGGPITASLQNLVSHFKEIFGRPVGEVPNSCCCKWMELTSSSHHLSPGAKYSASFAIGHLRWHHRTREVYPAVRSCCLSHAQLLRIWSNLAVLPTTSPAREIWHSRTRTHFSE